MEKWNLLTAVAAGLGLIFVIALYLITNYQRQTRRRMDWHKLLDEGELSEYQDPIHEWLSDLSSSWTTCPVGCKFGSNPREYSKEVYQLGKEFNEAVSRANWPSARRILREIDALPPPPSSARTV